MERFAKLFLCQNFSATTDPKNSLIWIFKVGMGYRMGDLRLKNSFQFNFLSITFLYFSYFVLFCIFIAKRPNITLWFSFTVIFIIICINRVAVQFFLFTSIVRKLNLICYSWWKVILELHLDKCMRMQNW